MRKHLSCKGTGEDFSFQVELSIYIQRPRGEKTLDTFQELLEGQRFG